MPPLRHPHPDQRGQGENQTLHEDRHRVLPQTATLTAPSPPRPYSTSFLHARLPDALLGTSLCPRLHCVQANNFTHKFCGRTKKSLSTVSSPIFACSSRSFSWSTALSPG